MTEKIPKGLEGLALKLSGLPRSSKRAILMIADVMLIPAMLWVAISLRSGTFVHDIPGEHWLYITAASASIAIMAWAGLYRSVVRYMGARIMLAALIGITLSLLPLYIASVVATGQSLKINSMIIYWAFALIYVVGSRFVGRGLLQYRQMQKARAVVIYGAGAAGAQLAIALGRSGPYRPVAFLDDDSSIQGRLVNGLEVFSPDQLCRLVEDEAVSTVLLALPSQSRRARQEVLKKLQSAAIHVLTVPDYGDIVAGHARVEDIRDVDASDLLGRDPVPPNETLLGACIQDKVVLVSGAGGSIGSELCRQILRLGPTRLLLFEMSELALYNIDRELRLLAESIGSEVEIVPLIGNAHHRFRMREVMQAYAVQTVYHAAAYKHVPIVEQNLIEGIHNNVFSTWYAAEAALECKVETFVLISTDKAVNPTNVMGATKRFAEIVLQGLQQRTTFTRFCMVRFGNVLESSGSVVPLFREQIKSGGPVTVTHKDVIRFFMTIPEASQLVLQAGSMAQGGDVFVLDMGNPVRIADLARRMINLMGRTVKEGPTSDGDIEIVYTGLRPAEKLFEELLIGANATGTDHPMIVRANEHCLPWEEVRATLDEMLTNLNNFDCHRAREVLERVVEEYRPLGGIQDLVWVKKAGASLATEASNVTTLQKRRGRTGAPGGAGRSATH